MDLSPVRVTEQSTTGAAPSGPEGRPLGNLEDRCSISFQNSQLIQLRAQIMAYRMLVRYQPMPANIANIAMAVTGNQIVPPHDGSSDLSSSTAPGTLAGRSIPVSSSLPPTAGTSSTEGLGTGPGGLPQIQPPGIDPVEMIQEREKSFAESSGKSTQPRALDVKTRAGAITLLNFQKSKIAKIVSCKLKQTTFGSSINVVAFKRVKITELRDARGTEMGKTEQTIETERIRRARQSKFHNDVLSRAIEMQAWHKDKIQKIQKINQSILAWHANADREKREEQLFGSPASSLISTMSSPQSNPPKPPLSLSDKLYIQTFSTLTSSPPPTPASQADSYRRLAVQLGTNIVRHDWDPLSSIALMEEYIRAANVLVDDQNCLNNYNDACLNEAGKHTNHSSKWMSKLSIDHPDIQDFIARHNSINSGDGEDWQWKRCLKREMGVRSSITMGRTYDETVSRNVSIELESELDSISSPSSSVDPGDGASTKPSVVERCKYEIIRDDIIAERNAKLTEMGFFKEFAGIRSNMKPVKKTPSVKMTKDELLPRRSGRISLPSKVLDES